MGEKKLKLKVCGLKYPENIIHLTNLQPAYMGFIFYPKSPRYCKEFIPVEIMLKIPSSIKKVGVFVNENIPTMKEIFDQYALDIIQLHGNESTAVCEELKSTGVDLIKAFQIDSEFDFKELIPYKDTCDYFLFDTKYSSYGGSGKSFDWNVLRDYDNEKPFFLSGGIDISSLEKIEKLKNMNLHALDINSMFETKPGMKEVGKVANFIRIMKNQNTEIQTL